MKFLKLEQSTIYPVDPWQITEDSFDLKRNLLSETIFSLANGYIGIRGSFEEGLNESVTKSIDGTYLNGFYESVPIPHTERGFGSALNTQTRLNVTDSKIIEVELDDERFCLDAGTILAYKRILDMKQGFQERAVTWRSPRGKEVNINVKRLVPFKHRHLLAIEYQLVPLNFSGNITIISSLNGDVDNHTHLENDPRFSASLGELCMTVSGIEFHDTGALITQKTKRSKLTMTCAMENHLTGGMLITTETGHTNKSVSKRFIMNVQANEPVTLVKYAAYYTSRDYPANELAELATNTAVHAKTIGFQTLLSEQEKYCRDYWDTVGISIEGDPKAVQGLRFNLFHLLQATGNKGQTSIAAKGLTSEGYDGHYFWDTETYLLPFYATIKPDEARNLLAYRYSILDHARKRARELSHEKGALYPWRTIAGEEGSSYFPASTAQYHINAAIAYAINKYIEITGDYSLMIDFGAEILFETARLWADLGTYVPRKGNRFCFNEVTGPDEYSALVNNNCYTNLMAQWHLRYAYETAQFLKQNYSEVYNSITKKISLQDEELQAWILAAEYMYVPYDEAMQIHPQDDGFLDKEIWDFSAMPQDKYPLLLYYHPLVIYRYQVCKQPDVILAHLLLGDRFSLQQKRRDYDYYEPITTHDSTLSPSIFSIVSSELGYRNDAYRFFSISARLDIDNIMNATHFGIHIANMAGTWLSLANGFAGMRTKAGKLSFDPYLPEQLSSYSFRVTFQDRRIEIAVKENSASYKLLVGEKISFTHHGETVDLEEGELAIHSLSDHESR